MKVNNTIKCGAATMSGQSQYLMLEYTNDLFDQRLYRKSFPTEIENTDVVPTMETKESSK